MLVCDVSGVGVVRQWWCVTLCRCVWVCCLVVCSVLCYAVACFSLSQGKAHTCVRRRAVHLMHMIVRHYSKELNF